MYNHCLLKEENVHHDSPQIHNEIHMTQWCEGITTRTREPRTSTRDRTTTRVRRFYMADRRMIGPSPMWYRIAMQTRRFTEVAITDLKGRLKRRVIGESTKVGCDRQNRLYAGNGDEIQAEQLRLLTTDKSVLHATYQITRTLHGVLA